MHKLGLLPLVKKFRIRRKLSGSPRLFSPERFKRGILHHFSALTNIQEFAIDCLDILSFMPKIRPYSGHFLPSIRSLVLESPKGSCRQIIYFIGLFRHLDDLKLPCDQYCPQCECVDGPNTGSILCPSSTRTIDADGPHEGEPFEGHD